MRSPDSWFEIHEVADGVIAVTESLGEVDRFGPVWTHTYLIRGDERTALIDASHGIGDLRAAVRSVTTADIKCLLTHYHFDHIGCAHQFHKVAIAEVEATLLMDPPTPEMQALTADIRNKCTRAVPDGFSFDNYDIEPTTPSRRLVEGDEIDLGGRSLRAIHTPGHSPGSICFLDSQDGLLFTGDTANRGLLTLSLELCDIPAYVESISRLVAMGAQIGQVLPAHWATPVETDVLTDLKDGIGRVVRGEVDASDMGTWLRADFERFAISLPHRAT